MRLSPALYRGIGPRTVTVRLARERHPSVGRNRLYLAMQSGALPSVSVGKRLAILVEDLDAWVASGCPTAASGPSATEAVGHDQ
jgi:hypothetical protein